jgi:hypothetical protein
MDTSKSTDMNHQTKDETAFQVLKKQRAESTDGPQFSLGRLVMTPGAREALTKVDITAPLYSHVRGDWGDVCREDWEENDLSLREGYRLLSVYQTADGTKYWVITEVDRSATTLLLPHEY